LRIAAITGLALACLLASAALGAQTPGPQGAELAGRLGCFACHSLKGRGGKLARPLDGAGARIAPRELRLALTFPRQLHPGARMPSYAYLPPAEQDALVKYLESLK